MMAVILLSFASLLLLAELLLKGYVENEISLKEERKLFGGKFLLRKVYNRGMALQFQEDHPERVKCFSLAAAIGVTFCFLVSLFRRKSGFLRKLGLALMTAGAWGNTADRFLRGYVVDYLAIKSKNKKVRKLTFNLSDLYLSIGGLTSLLGKNKR